MSMMNITKKQEYIFNFIFIIISSALFFYHINNFPNLYFDENHYVPAAKEWLNFAPTMNLEHPPLGKYIIAMGLALFGDTPLGWRVFSLVAGILSLYLCLALARMIFKNQILAFLIALFSLFNFWFYVQSRIAMLDIFMIFFLLLGFYFYLKSLSTGEKNKKLFTYLSAAGWGLAVACKWSAVFIYIPFYIIFAFKSYTEKSKATKSKDGILREILLFGITSVGIYYFTFLPYAFVETNLKISWWEIFINLQLKILDLQKAVIQAHSYNSPWYQWPFMIRPIWYEFIKLADSDNFRGVVLLGNPLQMVLGFFAILTGLFRWDKLNSNGKSILVLFLCSWLWWGLTSRKVSFFYYFFPSAIFYSFLVPIALKTYMNDKRVNQVMAILVVFSMVLFIYFFPILSGEVAPMNSLINYRWLEGWI